MSDLACKIDWCDKPARTRGWCQAHYRRWQRHGDPLGGGTRHKPRGVPCSIDACGKPAQRQGLCWGHYRRLREHGDVQANKPMEHREPRDTTRWPEVHIGPAWVPPDDVHVPCREHYPETFTGRDNAAQAASICTGCPVISDCFAAAVRQREWGTWGGVYFEEGQVIRVGRRAG